MRRGFTLIELLVVIAIIGVLSSLFVSNYMEVRKKSRDAKRMADLREVQKALELYRQSQSPPQYPSSLPTPCSSLTDTSGTVYLQTVPGDPKGSCPPNDISYVYQVSGTPPTDYTLIACLESVNEGENVKNCADYGVDTYCSDNVGGNGKCYVLKP